MKDVRRLAFGLLLDVEKKSAYSNLALKNTIEEEKLDRTEAAFLSNLVLGVIERKLTLDYNISQFLESPIKKLKTEILCVLRMGAFQILFMDNIPVSAAVNESVKIIKSTKFGFAQGLVNAVLRKISANGLLLPKTDDTSYDLSIKYSCPQWLIKVWIEAYGIRRAESILEYSVRVPQIYARVNINKISSLNLVDKLQSEGLKV
ncbi:MAG TPA: transcription antitermination factor NusB, partial [Clostridiales bacterium]|nr:transcription antitermination factor NusB [Clostridiales bacterium]